LTLEQQDDKNMIA